MNNDRGCHHLMMREGSLGERRSQALSGSNKLAAFDFAEVVRCCSPKRHQRRASLHVSADERRCAHGSGGIEILRAPSTNFALRDGGKIDR